MISPCLVLTKSEEMDANKPTCFSQGISKVWFSQYLASQQKVKSKADKAKNVALKNWVTLWQAKGLGVCYTREMGLPSQLALANKLETAQLNEILGLWT